MEIIKGIVRVELEDIGEGWNGDYDAGDPEDTPLLRFTVSRLDGGAWEQVSDASYCTQIPVATPDTRQLEILDYIMNEVHSRVTNGESVKKICEALSWLNGQALA